MKKTLGRRWLSLLLACALCLTLIPAVFADDPDQTPDSDAASPALNSIILTKKTLPSTITVGDTLDLTVTAAADPAGAPLDGITYRWTSTNENVIAVSDNTATPTVSVKGVGTTDIEVTATCGTVTGTAKYEAVEVKAAPEPAASIKINHDSPLMTGVNNPLILSVTTVPAGQRIAWTSGDPEIATVNNNNNALSALKPGETTITAYLEDDEEVKDTIKVIVSGISVLKDPFSVNQNGTADLKEAVKCIGDARASTLSFRSQDTYYAQVNGTQVTGLQVGEATIEARANDGAYITTFKVKIEPDPSTELPLNGSINLTTNDILPFTKLYSDFTSQVGGSVKYITNLMVDSTAHGTLYYNYSSEAEPGRGVAQIENYYINPKAGQLDPRNITFVPKPSFNGGEVFITYSAVTDNSQYSCRIRVNITRGGDGTGSDADAITQTTKYNTPVKFNGIEFDQICRNRLGSNLNYVTFSLPNERQGTLYTNYVSEGNYGSRVTLNSHYSTKDLDDIWFVPAPGFEGSVVIYYTGFAKGSSGKSYTGQVIITVGKDSASSIGGLS